MDIHFRYSFNIYAMRGELVIRTPHFFGLPKINQRKTYRFIAKCRDDVNNRYPEEMGESIAMLKDELCKQITRTNSARETKRLKEIQETMNMYL